MTGQTRNKLHPILHLMNRAIRIALAALSIWMLSSCRSLRKHSPWEVYRSANV